MFEAFSDEHVVHVNALEASGEGLVMEGLQPVHTARTVRVREGRMSITDGPFALTREQLGGICLVEAPGMEDALRIAARIPAARVGAIEVRLGWDLRSHAPRAWRRS